MLPLLRQSIFHNIWNEVRKKERLRKQHFVFNNNVLLLFTRWRHFVNSVCWKWTQQTYSQLVHGVAIDTFNKKAVLS